jgi:hypothetical protein
MLCRDIPLYRNEFANISLMNFSAYSNHKDSANDRSNFYVNYNKLTGNKLLSNNYFSSNIVGGEGNNSIDYYVNNSYNNLSMHSKITINKENHNNIQNPLFNVGLYTSYYSLPSSIGLFFVFDAVSGDPITQPPYMYFGDNININNQISSPDKKNSNFMNNNYENDNFQNGRNKALLLFYICGFNILIGF